MFQALEVVGADEGTFEELYDQYRAAVGQALGVDADVFVLAGGIEAVDAALDVTSDHHVAKSDAEV